MKAIETSFKGYKFRSRLEARWAVYLEEIGIKWEYEKEGYDLDGIWYLPDFWLPQVNMWAEVKPEPFKADELEKIKRLAKHTGHACIMLVGVPDFKSYDYVEWHEDDWHFTDCVISMYHRYPIDEHRFYSNTGGLTRDDFGRFGMFVDVGDGVLSARRARFEHLA